MTESAKPVSPAIRALRVFWAALLALGLVFSILMAAWGDLREALMLKVLDDRHTKSFTVVAPDGAKLWLGNAYLGEAAPHSLAEGEPEDSQLEVEGMSVLLPRVYFSAGQLDEQSVPDGFNPYKLLEQLAPETDLVWMVRMTDGFGEALLKHDDGRLDFVVIAHLQSLNGNRYFLLRLEHELGHVFSLDRTEIWSDQLCADEGGFWPQRKQCEGLPPDLRGQMKTMWRFYLKLEDEEEFLKKHAPGETDIKWFKLAEK